MAPHCARLARQRACHIFICGVIMLQRRVCQATLPRHVLWCARGMHVVASPRTRESGTELELAGAACVGDDRALAAVAQGAVGTCRRRAIAAHGVRPCDVVDHDSSARSSTRIGTAHGLRCSRTHYGHCSGRCGVGASASQWHLYTPRTSVRVTLEQREEQLELELKLTVA